MSALRLKAQAYFNQKLADNTYKGILPIIGSTEFSFKQSNKVDKLISKGRDDYGSVRAAIPNREPTDFTWKRDEADEDTLAMATMGESVPMSVVAGTLTADPTTAKKGFYVPIGGLNPVMNITAGSVVVTNTGATVTYVEGTDYSIDYALGFFVAAVGGDITADQALKITCAHGAMTGFTVNTEVNSSFRGALILHGINMADDSKVLVRIPEVLIVSDSPIDFLTDKWVEFQFSGSCIKLANETSPYYISNYR